MDFAEIKNFSSKETIKKMNRQAMDWKKIFVKHKLDRGLIATIYRELLLSNKDKKIAWTDRGFEKTFHNRRCMNGK